MEYKKGYTSEELADIIKWVKENSHRLPESLQLDPATFIPNLHRTIENYIKISEAHYKNPTYNAQIHHLFLVREKLINDNLLLPE